MSDSPLRKYISSAVFIHDYSVSGVAYSGGRYHALLLAYAMAHGGINVTVVTDRRPAFVDDLESAYGATVTYSVSQEYDPSVVEGRFDFVFVAPTGGFNPPFYACAEAVAGRSRATMVLVNYESANWFNNLAPEPDHLEVWDYWRRVMVHGGVVLSSNIESDTHARGYYRADGEPLHFANCYPPLNSRTALRALEGREKRWRAHLFCPSFQRP